MFGGKWKQSSLDHIILLITICNSYDYELKNTHVMLIQTWPDKVEHLAEVIVIILIQVFTPEVFKGLLGFSTWWCCFVWFSSAAIGVGYQSYFYKV